MAGEARLADLCESIVDCPHSTPVWTDSGVVVLRNQNIRNGRLDLSEPSYTDEAHFVDRTRRALPTEDDLVITREAPMGEVCMIPPDLRCCLGQRMVLLRPNRQRAEPRYLLYALQSKAVQHEIGVNEGTGSTVSNLRIPLLAALPIPTRPLPEQRAISHILGTLDDKIELNRRMSETLESIARALFKSWFVDFDPVRAKVEGRDPGLPDAIADLFPDALTEHPDLGEIPEGWEVRPLPEVVAVNPSRTLRRGEVAPYLDMANMPTRNHSPDLVVERDFGSGMRFVNGDTLVARITPCLENGKTAFVDFLDADQVGWGSTEYIVLRPRPPLPPEFAYCLARSAAFRDFAILSMTGSSGRQRVPADSLSHFKLVVAPKPVVDLFGSLVHPLFARAGAATRASRTLTALRDALLPKLISGELRVTDAERFTERTVQ
ncbi:MAG TPA: restriction endonuclease subunit S [Candidatus Krumholzibacteria bacterium]|nr:restriction endonuclease subunit S [Candidatus Krumholzibacteria bacterium]HPD73300.1 restriction endonuclease subunit S [Candidatus Krumholzibacteria bacterium]HRY42016.1 restriction endonuclease subunit S [Candidatus Krumholzibacteria bacterium]